MDENIPVTLIDDDESRSLEYDDEIEESQQNKICSKRPSAGSTSSTATSNVTSTTGKRQKEMPPCFVCGAKANGYNFDQITCESCKAFFRRNALKSTDKFRCRSNNRCPITVTTRKRCKRCRLNKCFQVGMRKEWILTEEEKTIKRQKIAQNRLIKMRAQQELNQQANNNEPNSRESVESTNSDSDQSSIISLPNMQMFSPVDQKLFERHFHLLGQLSNGYHMIARQFPQPKKFSSQSSLISQTIETESKLFLIKELTRELTEMTTTRLLNFFTLIPEFQGFNQQEKKIILTQNMLTVFMFHGALTYNAENDTFVDRATNDRPYDAKYLHFVYGSRVYNTFIGLARRMTAVTFQSIDEKHPDQHSHTLFLLLMVILLFSSDFHSHSVDHPQNEQFKLRQKLNRIQQHYVEIACRFIQDRFGFVLGRRVFQKLVPLLQELQKLCSTLAHVNLCEMAEDDHRSNLSTSTNDSRTGYVSRSDQMDSPTEFNSTMISGTSHLNELQKENRAPALQISTSTAASSHRTPPSILTDMPQTAQTSTTLTVSQQYYSY